MKKFQDELIQRPVDENLIQSNYEKFNETCRRELARARTVESLIKSDGYFFRIDVAAEWCDLDRSDPLHASISQRLKFLDGKFGIYHLWHPRGLGIDRKEGILQALYVGKGHLRIRTDVHLTKHLNDFGTLFISFYECENRIAKYLEQLFLDTFQFPRNSAETSETGDCLYTKIDRKTFETGSNASEEAYAYSLSVEKKV